MDGQISLFDYAKEIQKPPTFSTTVYMEDGFVLTKEYEHPTPDLWDDVKAKHGAILDFRMNRGGDLKNMAWRSPCYRFCDCECWSLLCFLKRGYIRHDGLWVRNSKGEIMVANNKECDWTPKDKGKEEHI